MEYALEYGFLRLTPKTRERLNITHYCFLYSMARGEVHSGVCLRVRVSSPDTKNKGEIKHNGHACYLRYMFSHFYKIIIKAHTYQGM